MDDITIDSLMSVTRIALANRVAIILLGAGKSFTNANIVDAYLIVTRGKRGDQAAELQVCEDVLALGDAIERVRRGDSP